MIRDRLIKKQDEIEKVKKNIKELNDDLVEKRKRNIEKYQEELFSLIGFIIQNQLKSCEFCRDYKGKTIKTIITCKYYSNKRLWADFSIKYEIDDNSIVIIIDNDKQLKKTYNDCSLKCIGEYIGVISFDFIENCKDLEEVSLLVSLFKEDMNDLSTIKDSIVDNMLQYESCFKINNNNNFIERYTSSIDYLKSINSRFQNYNI